MAPSSSQAGPSRPPSSTGPGSGRPPQTQNQAGSSSTGTGIGMHASNSTPRPPPVPTAQAQGVRPPAQPSNAGTRSTTTSASAPTVTPPKPQAPSAPHSNASRNRDRQVTPPPLPRPRSPPPTTPHRRALRDLLQADGKMSPSLAKDLVNNPSLLALLKSIPTTKSDSTSTLTGTAKGKGKAKDDSAKPNGNGPSSSRSTRDRDGTPTPTAPKTAVKGESIPGGCFNCGTMHTTMWRVKSYPDGTKKKVCDGKSRVPVKSRGERDNADPQHADCTLTNINRCVLRNYGIRKLVPPPPLQSLDQDQESKDPTHTLLLLLEFDKVRD
jgi:hypothetical protein